MKRLCILAVGTLSLLMVVVFISLVRSPLGFRTASTLRGATKVEVFRLGGQVTRSDGKPKGGYIGGFFVSSQGKDQGHGFGGRLADILNDPQTYTSSQAACFDPGVAFRVWMGVTAVDIIICFKCDNFYSGPPTGDAHENASFHRSPNRRLLVQLVKESFPDDKDIQGLKE